MNAKKAIAVVICILAMMVIPLKAVGQAELSSIPIDPNAKILQTGKVVVPANAGTSATISVPGRGIFSIDFAVEPGKHVLLMLLTDAQYKAVLAGQQPQGSPLIRQSIDGVASFNYTLDGGVYDIFVLGNGSPDAQFTYRASWRPL